MSDTLHMIYSICSFALQWCHNERDSVSNHQPHDCLFNLLFRRRSKKTLKAPRHWPLCGEFTGDRWNLRTSDQLRGKCFHLMTSSWIQLFHLVLVWISLTFFQLTITHHLLGGWTNYYIVLWYDMASRSHCELKLLLSFLMHVTFLSGRRLRVYYRPVIDSFAFSHEPLCDPQGRMIRV